MNNTQLPTKVDTSLVGKRFLLIFLPLFILLLCASFWYYQIESFAKMTVIKSHESHELSHYQEVINTKIEMITSDLMVLASHRELLAAGPEDCLLSFATIQKDFLNFSSYKKIYDQVRFLDDTGMEQVRINYNTGRPSIVAQEDLQSKGERYYFLDTFKLAHGEIFVSPLDLNIEHGEVEQPLKPMIRIGTPVLNEKGKKVGIVLLNYFGIDLIHSIEHMSIDFPRNPMLLNSDGYWLKSANSEDEWGFMFKEKKHLTFHNRFPQVWQEVVKSDSGQVINKEGLFTFITIYPIYEGLKSSTGSPEAFKQSEGSIKPKEYYWKIILHVSPTALGAELKPLQLRITIIVFVFFILLACASWLISSSYTKREQAEKAYRQARSEWDLAFDILHAHVSILDNSGTILRANESMRKQFESAHGNLIGLDYRALYCGTSTPDPQPPCAAVLDGNEPVLLEAQFKTMPGWQHVSAYPIHDQENDQRGAVLVVEDITARKEAEEQLLLAKQDWERTFNAVPDLIAIIDDQFRFVRVNKAMADGLNLTPEQCIGQTCFELVHGREEPVSNCPHAQLLADGLPHEEEVTEDRLGGDYLVTTSPLHGLNGKLSGSVHVARDITQSKKSRIQMESLNTLKEKLLKLRGLQDKLKLITDSLVDIFQADFARIWIINPGDMCDAGCFHAEIKEGPHVCKYRDRCLHLLASSGRYTHIDGQGHGRVPFGCYKIGRIASEEEIKFITNDATHDPSVHDHAWAKELGLKSFAGYRLLSEEGKPIGVLALFSKHIIEQSEDLLIENVATTTAHVIKMARAEDEILHSRDSLQAVLDNIDAMVYITNLESYEIIMINKFVRDEFGNVEGQRCWKALQNNQAGPCEFCEINRLKQSDEKFHVWETQNTKSGRWYEHHDRLIRWTDNTIVRLQIATDITERKKTETQLQDYASTQKTLLQEVNHRVKNNLSAIISMLSMEEDRAHNKGLTLFSDFLHEISARIHGLSTVHSLLSASEWKPLSLTYLCEEVANGALCAVAKTAKVDLRVQPSTIKISSMPAHNLALVINELTTNTVKHAFPEKESIQIQITFEQASDNFVTVCFQDDGPGYPEEVVVGDLSQVNIGMEIIQGIITHTLQGEVKFSNDNGAVTTFSFKNFSKG